MSDESNIQLYPRYMEKWWLSEQKKKTKQLTLVGVLRKRLQQLTPRIKSPTRGVGNKNFGQEKICNVCERKYWPLVGGQNWEKSKYCNKACASLNTQNDAYIRKYGITITEKQKRLREQGGCAICGRKQASAWCVDHDHKTGEVREILCTFCNTAIGMLQDDPGLCIKASKYLKKHQKNVPIVLPERENVSEA